MVHITKEQLIDYYGQGLSMRQIALKISCSEHKIVYWMNKYGIKRRERSVASYTYYNPNGDPFIIKVDLNPDESILFGLGLGIYWGEGDKVSKYQVRVTNTDPEMIKVFTKFLVEICQVKKERIAYYLVCFNDSNIEKVAYFWSKQLNISKNKFGKIIQIPPQGKGSYKKKSQFGVCSVVISNVKLKTWILGKLKDQRFI